MAEALLPPEVLRIVDGVECVLQEVEEQFRRVLPSCTRESFEQLSLIERASTFSALSKALTVLFTVYLKTNGMSPDDHHVSRELARIDLYQDKVQKAVDTSTGPRRPTSSLDVKAANRFVEHAIPDLSEEQRKSLRELGKGAPKRQHQKVAISSTPIKRPSGLTIAEEAAAFLAEARKEVSVPRGGEACSDED